MTDYKVSDIASIYRMTNIGKLFFIGANSYEEFICSYNRQDLSKDLDIPTERSDFNRQIAYRLMETLDEKVIPMCKHKWNPDDNT